MKVAKGFLMDNFKARGELHTLPCTYNANTNTMTLEPLPQEDIPDEWIIRLCGDRIAKSSERRTAHLHLSPIGFEALKEDFKRNFANPLPSGRIPHLCYGDEWTLKEGDTWEDYEALVAKYFKHIKQKTQAYLQKEQKKLASVKDALKLLA